jgi:hypothetical protein
MDQVTVSQVFGDEAPPPLAPVLLECFDAARRRDLGALEASVARHGGSEQERKALVGLLESLELEAADKVGARQGGGSAQVNAQLRVRR